jgi:itaconate CoA-transferase
MRSNPMARISTYLIFSSAEHVLGLPRLHHRRSSMQKPLDGFLVVSLEQAVAAPMCSCRLADAGARVIKIERPEGDFARGYDNLVHGESAYFIWLNRGKESAALDLNNDTDKAVMESILSKADVFIQNLKPGALKKLGFSVERLHRDYPSLILCSISGYGESGPYAGRKAYDLLIQADSGLASITGGPQAAARVGVSVVDIATGLNAYEAILEALFLRARTGKGSVLSVSMFAAMADWMTVPLLQTEGGKPPRRMGLAHPSIAPYGVFKTKDGIDILISIQNDREWRLLAEKVMSNPALAQDTHFARNVDRVARRTETDRFVADAFGTRAAAELIAALGSADIAFARVTDMADLAGHPHLERITVSTPTGPATYPRPPVLWDGTQRIYGAVPALGQHTEAVRAEFLSGPSRKIGANG